MLAGGALTVSCGLHLSRFPTRAPVCLIPAGASIQDGQLQWAADPTRFFVPATAIASLKVISMSAPCSILAPIVHAVVVLLKDQTQAKSVRHGKIQFRLASQLTV